MEGDSNTRYFHMVANGRHRKKYIHSLHQDKGTIEGQTELKQYITDYYKTLFGPPEDSHMTLDEDRIGDIPQVSTEENAFLTAPFMEEEVKQAIFQWNIIKRPDLMVFRHSFIKTSGILLRMIC